MQDIFHAENKQMNGFRNVKPRNRRAKEKDRPDRCGIEVHYVRKYIRESYAHNTIIHIY